MSGVREAKEADIDGRLGDHVLIAPPFIAATHDIDVIVERLGDAVDAAIEDAQSG